MNRGRLINLINKLVTYEVMPMREIAGESRIDGNGFMAFYPDEDALTELVVSVFYR